MKKYLIKLLIFVTIALFAILIVEVFSTIIKVPKISYPNIYPKSQSLIPKINSNTILFLGDSRIEWGIKPIIIQNILNNKHNINVVNLAMPKSNGLDILTYLKSKNIFPKIIILGYTSNFGRYTNHDLDKIEYSNRNRIEERLKYFLKQNYFIYDYNSIKEYLMGRHPISINHEYDSLGGVNVTLYGNYQSKKEFQIKIYTEWSKDFSKDKLKAYYLSVKKFKQWFSKGGTKIYGLSMPASYDLIKLEHTNYIDQNVSELFDKYYDFSILNQTIVDSTYFLDGSHLTQEFAISFSERFAEKLKIENN
jgi:hypothetical protein